MAPFCKIQRIVILIFQQQQQQNGRSFHSLPIDSDSQLVKIVLSGSSPRSCPVGRSPTTAPTGGVVPPGRGLASFPNTPTACGVVVVADGLATSSGCWNIGEMRPRVSSAPSRHRGVAAAIVGGLGGVAGVHGSSGLLHESAGGSREFKSHINNIINLNTINNNNNGVYKCGTGSRVLRKVSGVIILYIDL